MSSSFDKAASLLATLLVTLLTLPALAQERSTPIAIIGADVLPMTGQERLRDHIVLVSGDRILAIGHRRSVPIPAGARRIEASGMTLMPGLVDMHVHVPPARGAPGDDAHRAMAVMLGHGVTTARGMGGLPGHLEVREAIERGALSGPRFYVAAPSLHNRNTPSPDAARQAVAAARPAGYDHIKLYEFRDVATWQAAQEEARRTGLPVTGHMTNQVGLDRAMAAGQQIEHLDGILFALLPEVAPERQIVFNQTPPPEVIAAVSRVSEADLDALARRIAAARSWHEPTLDFYHRLINVAVPFDRIRAVPAMRYLPDTQIARWAVQHEQLRQAGRTPAQIDAYGTLRRRIVRALHRAGVPLMAGSDALNAFQVWGDGLINEIEALHAAGLTPMEALRSATVVPRDYLRSLPNGGSALGWRADFGTIEPGARADLILLRGDPSRDLANLRRLDTVIAAGRVHDRAALDRMLDEASRAAKAVR